MVMLFSRLLFLRFSVALLFIAAGTASLSAQSKKLPPPPPAHAKSPSPAVTDDFVHQQFGENCSLLPGPQQFVAAINDDRVEDLRVSARGKNRIADTEEHNFLVASPYQPFLASTSRTS